ncbi:MAG: NAD(P)H-binding protein [Rhodospirillaceae bacterium]
MFRILCLTLTLTLIANTEGTVANASVLVFGGTGQLGSEIVQDLLEDGTVVTVFVRPTSKKQRLEGLDVAYVTGDVLNEDDVETALKSGPYSVVIDALARDSGVDPTFYVDSMKYISKWAVATKVKQVILHGSVGAGLSRPVYPEERWGDMAGTITAKDHGERHLIESGAPYTIIRNLVLLPHEVKESGAAELTTDQSARGVVTRDGVARLTLECMDNSDCINEIFHAIDPDVKRPGRWGEGID